MRIERWGKWKREGGRYLHSQLCLLQNIIIMLTSLRRATRPFCKVVALLISNSVSSTALFNSSRICRLILAPCRDTHPRCFAQYKVVQGGQREDGRLRNLVNRCHETPSDLSIETQYARLLFLFHELHISGRPSSGGSRVRKEGERRNEYAMCSLAR